MILDRSASGSAPADTAVEAASARAAGTPTLWAPRRGLHQPRLQQLEATEEPLDLTAAARHQRRGRLLVDGGDLGCRLRMEVRGGMRQHQEAARRHRVPQPGHDPGRVLLVSEEMQDGDQQHRHRLGEVEQPSHLGMAEDHLGLSQVRQHGDRGGVVGQQRVGMHVHDRVVVDVGHAHIRRDSLGDLVDVALGRQAGADVEEQADAGIGGQVAHCALQERPVLPGAPACLWRHVEDGVGGVSVGGEVVLAAEQGVVDPCRVGSAGIDAGRRAGLVVAGHGTSRWGLAAMPASQSGSGTLCSVASSATAVAG